nr:ribonuclease H-like domain-containing protein [Tanacetum cinerariifolium]
MSNTNNNIQTQTSNTLHNAIIEAGSKDRPPMLAPGWKDKEVPTSEGSLITTIETVHETYKNVSQEIRDQLNVEAEAVQIILTGIDNDIYSTVDACPNACEMWKAIERAEKIARVANRLALVAQQQPVYHPQTHPTHYTQNSSTRSQQAATRNRGKAIINSPRPIYDQEPSMVTEDDETSKDKEIDELMALISLSFKKIYKPTNNNLRTSSNTSRANQDNSPRIHRNAGYENQRIGNVTVARENVGSSVVHKFGIQCYNRKEFWHVARECQKSKKENDATYHREKMLLYMQEKAGIQLNAKQADWRDDTDDDELEDQELEAHYMYMAQLQEVSPDAADSGPIFDDEPLQKVSNDDHYNVFAIESAHPEQS